MTDAAQPADPTASAQPAQPQDAGRATIQSHTTASDIACPACGAHDEVYTWDTLEAICNPEQAARLATGELLVHRCSHCGALLPLDYPLFYIDRDRKQAVYYPAGQGDLEAVKTAFTQALVRFRGVDLPTLRKREYAMRVAPQRHELAEKVCAWRAGLDDELLEVFKASLLRELQGRNPDLGLADVQFAGLVAADGGAAGETEPAAASKPAGSVTTIAGSVPADAKLTFVLFRAQTDESGAAEVVPADARVTLPAEAYLRLGRSLEVRQAIDLHHSPVVDAAWGRTVLSHAERMAREG